MREGGADDPRLHRPGQRRQRPVRRPVRGRVGGRHARLLHHARRADRHRHRQLARRLRAVAGNTSLVSTGPAGGNGTPGAELVGISDDGTKAFFHTAESLVAADTDAVQDVYQRASGTTSLLSVRARAGGDGNAGRRLRQQLAGRLEGLLPHRRVAASGRHRRRHRRLRARQRATTTTIHSVEPERREERRGRDVRRRISPTGRRSSSRPRRSCSRRRSTATGRSTSTGAPAGRSRWSRPGGNDIVATARILHRCVVRRTAAACSSAPRRPCVAGDTDKYQDIYEYNGGTLTRLSLGPERRQRARARLLRRQLQDGTHVFFETYESLVHGRHRREHGRVRALGGATEHISGGVSGGNGPSTRRSGPCRPTASGSSSARPSRCWSPTRTSRRTSTPRTSPARSPSASTRSPTMPQDFNFHAFGLDDGFAFGPPTFGPTLFDLDDDADPTLPNQKVFATVTPGVGLLRVPDPVAGWDPTAATCDDGSSPSAIDVSAGEKVNCTFTEPEAGADRRGPGRPAERRAGLRVHRRRRAEPVELLARRRRRRHAVPHPDLRGTSCRAAATRSPSPCPAAGCRAAPPADDGSSLSNINVSPGRGRSPAPSRTSSAARSWS